MARLAIISDEISEDLDHALSVCEQLGIRDIELRSIDGRSIVDHDQASLERIRASLTAGGFAVCAIASPFLKTHIGDGHEPVGHTHSAQTLSRDQHWDVLKRSLEAAHLLEAPIVRTFSFWRVENPALVRNDVLETLQHATEIVKSSGKQLGLENEHACNVGSGTEAAWYLERVPDPTLGLIWDPGNITALGVEPNTRQYEAVADRIIHVHVKDGNAIPASHFVLPGTGACDWRSQLRWLHDSGYDGPLSIESHMEIDGSREAGSRAIAVALRQLATDAGMNIS